MSRTPKEIIADLAPAYKGWKSNEKDKEKLRKEFLAAVTEELEKGDLAEDIVVVNEPDEAKARSLAEKLVPSYRIIESRFNEEAGWEFIVQEDPAYKSYTIEYDGQVWGRQVVAGSTFVDDERMKEEDIDLYMEVTEYENEKEIKEVIKYTYDTDSWYEILEGFCEEKRDGKRVLKDFDDLTPVQLAQVQTFVYEGKPSVKLPAPKKASDE